MVTLDTAMKPAVEVTGRPKIDAATLVDAHGDHLFRYAMFRLRDPEAAEDAVQETLLAAMREAPMFRGQASERTWLTAILKHKICDQIRSAMRERPIGESVDELPELDRAFERSDQWKDHWNNKLQPHQWKDNPESDLQRKEFFQVLSGCLTKLPVQLFRVFALHEFDGLARDEVCRRLAISPSNYWVIMHRSRMALRRCIEVNWFRKVH